MIHTVRQHIFVPAPERPFIVRRILTLAILTGSLSTIPLRSTKLAIGWFPGRAANTNVRCSPAAAPWLQRTLLSASLRANGEDERGIERAHWSVGRPQKIIAMKAAP